MTHSYFAMPRAGFIIAVLAAAALAFVGVTQFVFGYQPCVLCLWQRAPYAVAVALGLAATLMRPYHGRTTALLGLCAFAFFVDAAIAGFHSGVERQWWLGTSGCAIQPHGGGGTQDLREQLLGTPVAHCDEISWSFLGLSLANWNILYALGCGVFATLACRRMSRSNRA